MNVSIIIPNYNGEELLEKNLPKVLEAIKDHKDDIEVIVVDDCSTDNSAEYIKNQISKIKNTYQKSKIVLRLVENSKNFGFSSTVNHGVKEATGEVIILLNTDVAPQKNFLEPLLKNFDNPKVFAVGCMDKSIDLPAGKAGDGKVILRGRGIGRWEKGLLVHSRGEVNKTNTLWVSGGSAAFRKSIWDKLGGLREFYNPFYWEDIDFSYRAIKSGYKILFEPKSIVIHEHEKGAIKKKYSPFKIKTIAYRNQFIFVWHNATDLDLQFLHVFWLPYHFIKALIRRDFAFFLGFFQALILTPKIIKSSLRVKKLFVKSDREIVQEFLK